MKYGLLFLLGFCFSGTMAQVPVVKAVDSNMVKGLFFAGLQDKLNENYDKAEESFKKIVALDPNNAAVYFEIATVNYRLKKMPEAELAIKKATDIDANNTWYWRFMAEVYKRKGDMQSLVDVFNQLIRLDPENDSYYFDRSNAWALAGKLDEARKGYDELEKKFGPSTALTAARARIGNDKSSGSQGDLPKKGSIDELKKAKQDDPDNYEIDLAIADFYKLQKNSADAQLALLSAFANKGMPVEQKIEIVMRAFSGTRNQQRLQDSKALAKLTAEVHPDDANVHAVYGEVLYQLDALPEALEQFEEVIKLTDQLYKAWEQMMNIQLKLKRFKEVVKTGDEALSVYPNQAILYYYMALAYQGNGDVTKATENIKMALQLDTENTVYKDLERELGKK